MQMTLVVSKWSRTEGRQVEHARRVITVTKRGRWLHAEGKTFNPTTGCETKASRSGMIGGFHYRLVVS